MKVVVITHLNSFGSKVLLTLKFMDFENVTLINIFQNETMILLNNI
jgi:hypothetical protein